MNEKCMQIVYIQIIEAKINFQGVIIVILLFFDRHCPALSQPFTKRVPLDQHIQLMHGVKDPEEKTISSDNTEALPEKETVLWH